MSSSKQIEHSVIHLVTEITNGSVSSDSSAGTLPEWDSLAQMKIIIQLEKTYDIEIEDEDIASLDSVAKIVSYLQEKQI